MARIFVAALAAMTISASSSAFASTELKPGAAFAGFPPDIISGERDREVATTYPFPIDDEQADWSSGLAEAIAASTDGPVADANGRFKWAIVVIAFAGLTAAFMGKRSGGRGLIVG